MREPMLEVRHLRKAFGGLVVTDDVSLDLRHGEIHALIGPNGAGKSTLIAQIAGEIRPNAGEILLVGENLTECPAEKRVRRGLVRSFQVSSVLDGFSVLENARLAALGRRLPHLGWWRPAASDQGAGLEALEALQKVRLAQRADTPVATLSYGERRQIELAMALALRPHALLLDEPMAGVGPEESRSLTRLLDELRQHCGILLVEHDMDVVFSLADRVSVLVEGRLMATAPPAEVRDMEEVQRAYFGAEDVW
ncbi:MAG TPA: ABC transporter ATP-binding protein [Paracoccaceae bacterium]|nr:ABC transporter ATP-binding protein [Paracoccaceae bacterium]